MKVALVHDYLLDMGGAERVLQVLAEIFPEAPIYTLLYDPQKMGRYFPAERVRAADFFNKFPAFLKRRQRWLLPLMPVATETINLRDFDLVISSSAAFIKGIVTRSNTIHISYCHTPTRFLWDLYHYYVSNGSKMNWLKKPLLHYLRLWDLAASQRVDHFIANSQNTRRRIKKYYNRDSEVIYPPIEIVDLGSRAIPPRPTNGEKLEAPFGDYYLIVSRLLSYKRIDLAVDAFNKLGLPLIVIGEGRERKNLAKRAKKHIQFLGWQPEEVRNVYMKHCAAFIFPGEEDFGMAPVEAMALGRPVLAYRAGGLLETVEEGKTGEFFDEQSAESLADGVQRLKEKLKNYQPEYIMKYAEKFGKERFVREIKQFVELVTNKN